MVLALRFVEYKQGGYRQGGYWEVKTEESTEHYPSLRRFQDEQLVPSATRALRQPGAWIMLSDPGKIILAERG